jgi:hypothetical protein
MEEAGFKGLDLLFRFFVFFFFFFFFLILIFILFSRMCHELVFVSVSVYR